MLNGYLELLKVWASALGRPGTTEAMVHPTTGVAVVGTAFWQSLQLPDAVWNKRLRLRAGMARVLQNHSVVLCPQHLAIDRVGHPVSDTQSGWIPSSFPFLSLDGWPSSDWREKSSLFSGQTHS